MSDWNPQQYLKFEKERTQPAIDLADRIQLRDPKTIIDLGCGPGNSTQVLHKRWPFADIVGLDNSGTMIEKARADYPHQKWEIGDAARLDLRQRYDIVFSNATLQWIPDHDVLLPRLFKMVNENGLLAIQMPANDESHFFKIMISVAAGERWYRYTAGCEKLLTYHDAGYYYDILSSLTPDLELWTTTYYHFMQSHRDLTEWHKSTGMRPFLDKLPDDKHREEFEEEIIRECMMSYPLQKDGHILYPFKRLFFLAGKMQMK